MAGDDDGQGGRDGRGVGCDHRRLAVFEEAIRRPMVVVSLAIIPVYVGQALAEGGPNSVTGPLRLARFAIHLLMLVELSIRTWLAPSRLRYLADHRLDLAAVVVPPVRALREIVGLRTVLARPGLARFGALATGIVAVSTLMVYAVEHDRAGADIRTLDDAFWWAAVTASTVGYGDEVPVSIEGRAVALVLMLLGIASFSVLTAHVGAYVAGGSATTALGREAGSLDDRLARIEAALAGIDQRLSDAIRAEASTGVEHDAARAGASDQR
jgi:voltage-gated potassium channel